MVIFGREKEPLPHFDWEDGQDGGLIQVELGSRVGEKGVSVDWIWSCGDRVNWKGVENTDVVQRLRERLGIKEEHMPNVKSVRETYYNHVSEAAKPISDRKETIIGRNGVKRVVRRHHLGMIAQTQLLQLCVSGGKFVSPYRKFTSYWGVTTALAKLGENQWHSPADVLAAMRECMSGEGSEDEFGKTAWERFKGRKSRSPDGLDYIGRILQNCNVLQRLGGDDPYGLKLAQLGACLDIKLGEDGLPMMKLRTGIPKGDPVSPVNEIKKRRSSKSVESIPSQITFLDPIGADSGAISEDGAVLV